MSLGVLLDKNIVGVFDLFGTPELLVRAPRVVSGESQTRWCAIPNLGFGRCLFDGRDPYGLDFGS